MTARAGSDINTNVPDTVIDDQHLETSLVAIKIFLLTTPVPKKQSAISSKLSMTYEPRYSSEAPPLLRSSRARLPVSSVSIGANMTRMTLWYPAVPFGDKMKDRSSSFQRLVG